MSRLKIASVCLKDSSERAAITYRGCFGNGATTLAKRSIALNLFWPGVRLAAIDGDPSHIRPWSATIHKE